MIRRILLENKAEGIVCIGSVIFLDTKLKIYYNPHSKNENEFMVSWKKEAKEGVCYAFPKFIILGRDYINKNDLNSIINLIVEKVKIPFPLNF